MAQRVQSEMLHEPVVHDTLIIGLGNPLRGDDGIGSSIVQSLAMQGLPDGVEVVDGGTCGLDLVMLLEGRRRVIVVDAAELGQAPGEFRRLTAAEVHVRGAGQQLSIHSAGLGDALLLAEALDVLPEELIIFGIQPANLEWGLGLSPGVEDALPNIVRGILAELV